MAAKPAMHAARRVQRSRAADGDKPSPTLRFLFLFIFNRSKSHGIGIFRAPMLPSNRRYAGTTKIPRPLRLPRLPAHCPTRPPLHHRGRPDFRLPHLRWRAEDRPVCVTKSRTIPATPSRKGTYPRTRNTLNSRILRHNSPSPGRLPRFAEAPHLTIPA